MQRARVPACSQLIASVPSARNFLAESIPGAVISAAEEQCGVQVVRDAPLFVVGQLSARPAGLDAVLITSHVGTRAARVIGPAFSTQNQADFPPVRVPWSEVAIV